MAIMMAAEDSDCTAFPDGDNLFHWCGTIQGVDGTPYEKVELINVVNFLFNDVFNIIFDFTVLHSLSSSFLSIFQPIILIRLPPLSSQHLATTLTSVRTDLFVSIF